LTQTPAQILKLPKGNLSVGAEADLTIFDPNEVWTFDDHNRYSLSSNSPWFGKQLKGRVKKTFVKGRLIFNHQP
jgi:dihydroorotase